MLTLAITTQQLQKLQQIHTSSKDLHAKFRSRKLKQLVRDFPAKLGCCENNRDEKNVKRAIKYAL